MADLPRAPEPTLPATTYRDRVNLALALLRSRLPGDPAAELVELALLGATIDELRTIDDGRP